MASLEQKPKVEPDGIKLEARYRGGDSPAVPASPAESVPWLHVAVVAQASNLRAPLSVQEAALSDVLAADVGTPDDWVPRSAEYIRLTGTCEASRSRILGSRERAKRTVVL